MGNGELTSDPEAYELPGVPWVSYFHKTGVAFHGTYWHDNFGRMMSHGCVNMRPDEAKWLFRWTMPSTGFQDWYRRGLGTLVEIS
jgi:lipoprotein-anchoring transpeptidase ErfK/SrfK